MGVAFLLGLMKMFWALIAMMLVQPCEYTQNHRIVTFESKFSAM